MRPLLGLVAVLLISLPAVATGEESQRCAAPDSADCREAAGPDGWETNHPGLVYTGAIFGAASLVSFGIVGGYVGEQPDALFYFALTSGATQWAVGVALMSAGLILDDAEREAPAVQPSVGISPTGVTLRWAF
jgi:hypothetical protein